MQKHIPIILKHGICVNVTFYIRSQGVCVIIRLRIIISNIDGYIDFRHGGFLGDLLMRFFLLWMITSFNLLISCGENASLIYQGLQSSDYKNQDESLDQDNDDNDDDKVYVVDDSEIDSSNFFVINGKTTTSYSAVVLTFNTLMSCSASIISHNAILTAAHCVKQGVDQYVRLNSSDIKAKYITYNTKLNTLSYSTAMYDIAVVVFADNSFKSISTPIQIVPDVPAAGTQVRLVGWGCMTRVSSGTQDGYRISECNPSQTQLVKRTGTNTIVANDQQCPQNTLQIVQKTAKEDSQISTPSGTDVIGSPGDSGGPLLLTSDTTKLVGVASAANNYYMNNRATCYAIPTWKPSSAANLDVLQKAVSEGGAYIPGINLSVGVIAVGKKLRVVEKQYKNVYNSKVADTPFTLSSLGSTSITSISELKNAWNNLSISNRTKVSWNKQ